ncbi:PKD-like domain-containing protein, partial [Fulvivirga sp.]|uniref:PKD-like domain-containing protein n=1 Tax=Fulvivirga sp. TaxID=1931237 RepID=UPI0032ECCFE4
MKIYLRLTLLIVFLGFAEAAFGQCGALPPISAVGSNKGGSDFCAPVTKDLIYDITFFSPLATGVPNRLFFRWNDGSPDEFVLLPDGSTTYNIVRSHNFPTDSDCEYEVEMILSVAGQFCTSTQQLQKVASWRTDAFNGGNVSLVSPLTNTSVHEVCEGEDISVVFNDVTTYNCNAVYDPLPTPPTGPVIQPNEQMRWQQIVYNTPIAGSKIPNISVDGVPVTGAGGADIIANYQDSRGVFLMTAPVIINDGRRRPTLTITAPGGFTPGFPVIGDEFEVTIRYWNFCNPYANDFDTTPVGGDVINGDNPPVEETAIIRIVDAPPAPAATDNTVCQGDAVPNFTLNIPGASTQVNWYEDNSGNPGNLITNSISNNSNILQPSDFEPGGSINSNVPGIYTVWASYLRNTGSLVCESEIIPITTTIRENLAQPGAIAGTNQVCNGTNGVGFSLAAAAGSTPFGGAAEYQWQVQGGGGVTLSSTTAQNITADFNIGGVFTTETRTIRVRRRYSTNPTCNSPWRNFTVTIFGNTDGGNTDPDNIICEGDNTGDIDLTDEIGSILNWERSDNGGPFIDIGNAGSDTFNEDLFVAGTYEYRAVVDNGPCTTERSTITTITVNPIPATPTITEVGDGLDICENGDQVILQSSDADGNADEYAWFNVLDLVTPVQQSASNQLILTSPAESGSYRVQVIGINPTNCESPLSAPIDVVINPLPTATVSGGGSVCAGIPGPPAVITFTGTGPWDVTYERNGNPTTVNSVTSPYVIPGSSTVTDDPDTYIVTSITDLGTTVNCTVTAPSANIAGSATIQTSGTPPPLIDDFLVGGAICDDGPGTPLPTITLDLDPNSVENYDIDFEVRNSALAVVLTRTINKNTDAAGVLTFAAADLDYADLSNLPDTYELRLTSIINTVTGCNAAGLPANQNIIINPRPADPTNPIGATACSSDPTGATLSVDDPGAGFVVRWYTAYTDELTNTPAIGVTGGSNEETFTPTLNTTQTYIAVVESNTAPTNCHSVNTLDVEHIQDLLPTAADADLDNDVTLLETCTDELLLGAIAADNGGTGTWTFPGLLFYEDFNGFSDGTYQSLGTFGWSRDISTTAFDDPTDHFEVRSNAFEANDLNGEGIWNSEPIDISAIANFDISIDAIEVGDHEGTDYIQLWYQIDANAEQMVGQVTGNFGTSPISGTIPTGGGTNVVIRVKVLNNANAEFLSFDNVSLTDAAGTLLAFDDIHDENATVSGLPVGVTTLTWSVASALGSCSPTTETVDVQRNPLPTANDITPELCDEVFGNPLEVTGVDLTIALYSDAITGIVGSVNRSIAYFDDPSRNIADLIPDPTDVDISNSEVIYVRVTDTDPSLNTTCTSDSEITFTVHPLPAVTEPTLASRTFCEDVQGSGLHAGVDLDTYNAQISGTTTITWFPSLADAEAGSNQIAAGAAVGQVGNFTVFGGNSVFARAEDANGCANFQEVTFVTSPLPVDNTITGNAIDCSSATAVKIYQMDATLNAFGSTHVYNWTVTGGAGVNFEVFDGTTFTTTNSYTVTQASFLLLLRFPNPGTFTITGSETIDGCTGNDVQRIVNISGAPPALAFDAPETQVCKGETGVTYSLVGGAQAGSNYVWTVIGGTIVGPGSGNIATITVNWGTTTAPQPSVSVTESNATGCTGAPVSVNVFLNDVPVMTSASSTTICSDDSPSSNINFTATVGGAAPINPITFNWRVTNVAANVSGVVLNQTGVGNLTDQITNVSGSSGIVQYIVTPTENELPVSPACEGVGQTITVTVEPQPVIVPAQVKTICSGDNVDYHVNLTPAGLPLNTEYSWGLPVMSDGSVQGTT